MTTIEYLGGLPGRATINPIAASVQDDTLRLKHGRLFGGWSYQVPLTAIISVELTTVREIVARNHLPTTVAAGLDQTQSGYLAVAVSPSDNPATIILRGPWADLTSLRQAILQGRMRASKQWRA